MTPWECLPMFCAFALLAAVVVALFLAWRRLAKPPSVEDLEARICEIEREMKKSISPLLKEELVDLIARRNALLKR